MVDTNPTADPVKKYAYPPGRPRVIIYIFRNQRENDKLFLQDRWIVTDPIDNFRYLVRLIMKIAPALVFFLKIFAFNSQGVVKYQCIVCCISS